MRFLFLFYLLLASCSRAPLASAPSPLPLGKCRFESLAILEPTTGGEAEMSTLKDPSDPRYAVGDMIMMNEEIPLDQRVTIITLFKDSEKNVDSIQSQVNRLTSMYFRASVNPHRDQRLLAQIREDLHAAQGRQLDARLGLIDKIEGVLGNWTQVDRNKIERALLREDRRRAQLENMKCEF